MACSKDISDDAQLGVGRQTQVADQRHQAERVLFLGHRQRTAARVADFSGWTVVAKTISHPEGTNVTSPTLRGLRSSPCSLALLTWTSVSWTRWGPRRTCQDVQHHRMSKVKRLKVSGMSCQMWSMPVGRM
jgi:hypothetical protein